MFITLQIIVVLVLSGWIYARVKQNGYPINERTKEQFAKNMIIDGPFILGVCYFVGWIFLTGAVMDPFGFLKILVVFIGVLAAGIVLLLIIFSVGAFIVIGIEKLAPQLMRKNKKTDTDHSTDCYSM